MPPLEGPLFRCPCNGMHYEVGSPHDWVTDREELIEWCDQ